MVARFTEANPDVEVELVITDREAGYQEQDWEQHHTILV